MLKGNGTTDFDKKISRILGAVYTIGDNSMLKASVVSETDPVAFAPYAFTKWDQ